VGEKSIVVGIDPGRKGAVAFLNTKTYEAHVYDMPEDERDLIPLFKTCLNEISLVAVERQQAFPRQGISSTFKLAKHYGTILGILKALGLSYEEVHPHRWQKRLLGNGKRKRKESKKLSLEKARALFPDVPIGRKHGRSDALLIAEWARRERKIN
jgi:crossover junction endodeoxyribonuclease RuvC